MRNALHAFALAAYAVGAPLSLAAQSQPAMPEYNVLTVFRETVKIGKGTAHDEHEEAWSRASAGVKNQIPMLAIASMTGTQENWYMNIFPTWADMDKARAALGAEQDAIDKRFSAREDEFLSDGRQMIFRL